MSNPIVGEDREWMDGIGDTTVFMAVHDAKTFNINVFKSLNGGETYFDGYGQGIDPPNLPRGPRRPSDQYRHMWRAASA